MDVDLTVIEEGAAKTSPYTILFVANPVLEVQTGREADPLDPFDFEAAVMHATEAIFGDLPDQTEQFMSNASTRPYVRLLQAAVSNVTAADLIPANALIEETSLMRGMIVPLRRRILDWITTHAEPADVVIVISDSRNCARSSSFGATDNTTAGGQPFTLDGAGGTHWYHSRIPGTIALHLVGARGDSVEAAHEFGHAASGYQSGYVADLYSDPCTPCLNVKIGNHATPVFGRYQNAKFVTDPDRGGLGWNPPHNSYHCERVNAVPALMDNFNGDGVECRHDAITARFLADRILAKIDR